MAKAAVTVGSPSAHCRLTVGEISKHTGEDNWELRIGNWELRTEDGG